MTQENYALLTRTGRLKEAQRMAGLAVPAITHMAFGDMDRSPTGGETALGQEVHRAALTGWGVYEDRTAAFFDCYLPAAVGGFVIREVGLYDATGDLVAIARRSPGLPKTTPDDGGGDDFTLRIDVFFEDLDTLVVQVSPIAGITADNLHLFLFANNLPVEAVLSSVPGSPIDRGQWIVAPAPTGIWTGKAHQIARYRNGAWSYEVPRAGRMASYWTGTRQIVLRFDGAAWAEWLATSDAAGPVELATAAETALGIDTSRAVTPAGLRPTLVRLANADIPVTGWQAAPPGAPAEGDRYIVATGASGAWAGNSNAIAMWIGGAWAFQAPASGLIVNFWTGARLVILYWTGAAWIDKAVSERAQPLNYRVAGGTASALTATLDPVPPSYAELTGAPLRLFISASNPGAATLNINGLGAKEIVRQDGKQLVRNDLLAGDIKTVVYDGTRFRVFTAISSIERTLTLSAVSNQYMSDGVETFVSWVSPLAINDPLGFFNPAQPTRVTIPAGISIVRLGFAVGLEPSTTGYRSARVLQNGAIEGGGRPLDVVETPLAGQIAIPNAVGAPIVVAPGDYFQLSVFTNPGGPHLLRQGNTNMTIEY